MFKSAATKIAHNSTLPSLGGNKDLRPLQDLITAEKAVLITLQKLSVDLTKASDALRVWGNGEGEDLGDILGASTTVMSHFSTALSSYASKEHAIRDHLKAIRTREEALDELKRRRKATLARADSAEKKLNKMGAEHKNLAAQTDTLAQLQAQIRQMDGEIMNEEAALGDFKRSSTRAFMGLKFGGLLETSEKGCIVADMGIVIASEIPEDVTPPGSGRAMYMGHQQTSQRVMEAEHAVNGIAFSGVLPSVGSAPQPRGAPPRLHVADPDNLSMQNTGISSFNPGYGNGMESISVQNTGLSYEPPPPSNVNSGFLPPPDVNSGFLDGRASPGSSFSYQPPQQLQQGPSDGSAFASSQPGGYTASTLSSVYVPPTMQGGYSAPGGYEYSSAGGVEGLPEQSREEPAAGLSSTGVGLGSEGPGGGRFATFPVRGRSYSASGQTQGQSPPAATYSDPPPSLGAMTRKDTSGSDFMSSVLDAGEFGFIAQYPLDAPTSPPQVPTNSQAAELAKLSEKHQERERERQRTMHEDDPVPEYQLEASTHHEYSSPGSSFPPGPPPGAAPPVMGGVWAGEVTPRPPANQLAVEEGGGDRKSTVTNESEDFSLAYMNNEHDEEALLPGENEQQRQARLSKHVRFGGEGVFGETEPPFVKRQNSSPALRKRVPPPTFDPEVDNERVLNAAAAREITQEMNALSQLPPVPVIPQHYEETNWEPPQPQPPSPDRNYIVSSPVHEQPTQPQYGSPPRERQRSMSPQPQLYSPPTQYHQPLPNPHYNAPGQYQPPVPMREPSPRIPPVSRTTTMDSHQTTPSWDSGSGKPSNTGHHTTPSWALSPSSPVEGPASPRLDAPYRPFASRSSSSVNSVGQAPAGAKTISAAAFRRPQKSPGMGMGPEIADTSPLAPKKRLPASPYPQQRQNAAAVPPQAQHPDDFDYISAYERDSHAFFDDAHSGSPVQTDFGRLGNVQVVGGRPPGSPTYGNDGREDVR
ncbi:hypothetical protein MIND_01294800 [Mycena indigotica]|uniref:Eisosome component PIL1-domain-containing protein n=1 Tax=Mycena indigotica TaxID=2126181 RepID=A0A8H6S2B1_9AGAR|nr:uncharacterized protein MIND_01294800 [Mycena indigotica]KAF7290547.1 hypothetical protein MIND_01294800 [Mycena indigotica]